MNILLNILSDPFVAAIAFILFIVLGLIIIGVLCVLLILSRERSSQPKTKPLQLKTKIQIEGNEENETLENKIEDVGFTDLESASKGVRCKFDKSNCGMKIIIAIIGTALITVVWSFVTFLSLGGTSSKFNMAFLISLIFPITTFSFFVIRGGKTHKKFLYCSLSCAIALFIFVIPDIHESVYIIYLILPIIGWLYIFDW